MLIHFKFAWLKSGDSLLKAFKKEAALGLFQDYLSRLSKFTACKVSKMDAVLSKPTNRRWLCDQAMGATLLSSGALAKKIQNLESSAVRELEILIGGPDGFSAKELKELNPAMRWGFGPLTLTHELAAIVACEQIYRAYTILRNHPYHKGH